MSTSSNWWANKLGTQPQTNLPPVAPPPPQFNQPPQPAYQNPNPRLPQSSATNTRCPGCGGPNFGGATPESRPRCYDCGYPIVQSGTGVPGVRTPSEGPVQAAKQIANGGWNPTTIIGKVE